MADAKTTLTNAIENEANLKAAHAQKKTALAAAVAAKGQLIASASTGAAVQPADVMKAETAVRQAEIESQIAEQVHAGAVRLRHEAEIDAWWAEANGIQTLIIDKAFLVVEADDAVKAIEATLRQAEAERERRLSDYAAVHWTGKIFNGNVAIRNLNPVLAALDSGIERPLVRGAAILRGPEFAGRFQEGVPSIELARADVAKAKSNAAAVGGVKA